MVILVPNLDSKKTLENPEGHYALWYLVTYCKHIHKDVALFSVANAHVFTWVSRITGETPKSPVFLTYLTLIHVLLFCWGETSYKVKTHLERHSSYLMKLLKG